MKSTTRTRRVQAVGTTRRGFLQGAAIGGAFSIVPACVLGRGVKPPSEKLNVAGVGLGVIGAKNLACCQSENVVALCDVDWQIASVTFQQNPQARKYHDFRRMLDREKSIDAVIVATPDHTHAVISAESMRRGKHVYAQMPLAHDVWETRQLTRIAAESGVVTQMGSERYSGPTIRRVCEWIWDGAIGPVREVHCWTNRPQWPQGMGRPTGKPPVPAELNWDLWLGPAPVRPYHPDYHPHGWRGWQDFGTGALGAIGCHVMDAAYWALRLGDAKSPRVEAETTERNTETYPQSSTVRYRFPARGMMPPVTLHWYDGGRMPPRPPEWPKTREFMGSNGTIFVGERGSLVYGGVMAGTNPGQAGPWLLPESLMRTYEQPKQTLPRVRPAGGRWVEFARHEQEWIRACKGGAPACCRFDIAGPLTELALLGNVAILAGKPIDWDAETMTVGGEPDTERRLRRPYRKGWHL